MILHILQIWFRLIYISAQAGRRSHANEPCTHKNLHGANQGHLSHNTLTFLKLQSPIQPSSLTSIERKIREYIGDTGHRHTASRSVIFVINTSNCGLLLDTGDRIYFILSHFQREAKFGGEKVMQWLYIRWAHHVWDTIGDRVAVLTIRADHRTFFNMNLFWRIMKKTSLQRFRQRTSSRTWWRALRKSSSSISGSSAGKDVSPT